MSEINDDLIRAYSAMRRWLALEAEHEQLDRAAAVEEAGILERQGRLAVIQRRDMAIEQEQAELLAPLATAVTDLGAVVWDGQGGVRLVLTVNPAGRVVARPAASWGRLAGRLAPKPVNPSTIKAVFAHPDEDDADDTGEFAPVSASLALIDQEAS